MNDKMTEKEYLKQRLKTLASWCATRADGDHDPETTLSLLRRKMAQTEDGVNKALRKSAALKIKNAATELMYELLSK